MENASKALIIAGAILISILLVSVGILIMNSTGNVTDQVGSQDAAMAIQAYNSQFTKYEGTGKTLSEIRQLASVVNASNSTVKLTGHTHQINERIYPNKTDNLKHWDWAKVTMYVYMPWTGVPDGVMYLYESAKHALSDTDKYTVEIVYFPSNANYGLGGYVKQINVRIEK